MENPSVNADITFEKGMKSSGEALDLIEKLFDVTRPGAVFAEPVEAGQYTVITASEVRVGMGAGAGYGSGYGPSQGAGASGEGAAHVAGTEPAGMSGGEGGGGGGGGFSLGRPVAVISVGPTGVLVQPVVDVTKLAVAFVTMLGTLLTMRRKMRGDDD